MAQHFEANGKVGFWGPVTSTLDWCETNYHVTHYCAEFFNAATNIWFGYLVAKGLYMTRQLKAEWRIVALFIGLGIVASGSIAFHSTLHFEWQLTDELPMVYITSLMLFCQLHLTSDKHSFWTASGLVLYCAGITAGYLKTRNPLIFLGGYTFLTVFVALLPLGHIKKFNAKHPDLWPLFLWASASYVTGFVFWILENEFCVPFFRPMKEKLGYPLSIFLEFHGWWHFFSGLGAYSSLIQIAYFRFLYLGKKNFKLVYILFGIVPFLAKVEEPLTNGATIKTRSKSKKQQ